MFYLGAVNKIMLDLSKLVCSFTILNKSQIASYLRPYLKAVKGQNNDEKHSSYLFTTP